MTPRKRSGGTGNTTVVPGVGGYLISLLPLVTRMLGLGLQERTAAKVQTPEGKALYARRKVIVEPVFGQIKEARGFRRFLLRGLAHIRGEWRLVCLTHNLLKMWRHGRVLSAA